MEKPWKQDKIGEVKFAPVSMYIDNLARITIHSNKNDSMKLYMPLHGETLSCHSAPKHFLAEPDT